MGFLASIFTGPVLGTLLDKLIAPLSDAFKAYENKQISIEELRSRMVAALLGAFQAVEVAHADTLAKTYATFMGAVEKSLLMRVVWASVTISQLLVLLWHQMGIPAIVALGWVEKYPSSGGTDSYAYLLVGACVGLGPMVLRAGPTAPNFADLKSLILK